ncbi:MAG TPA: GrpB family protein [Gemmatimonadaceae bacterium]
MRRDRRSALTSASPQAALGLADGTVRVVPCDPRWPDLFAAEAARIAAILSAHGVALQLEHTGSTAVPGLAAKPVLDVLAGWSEDGARAAAIGALEAADYQYRGEQGIVGRDFFRRGEPRQYHLHLTRVDSTFWADQRTFRDYLRATPAAATAYAALKFALAAQYPTDRERYIDGKAEFVRAALTAARAAIPPRGG